MRTWEGLARETRSRSHNTPIAHPYHNLNGMGFRMGVEQLLGLTYGDIHKAAGKTAEHGIIGSARVAWHPSTKVGAPAEGGTLRQLNGVHRDNKVPLKCSIGTGAGVHQLEIFAQLPMVAIQNMKDFLVGKGRQCIHIPSGLLPYNWRSP
eukprot:1531552-Pyramimonas_sp.AAC.1